VSGTITGLVVTITDKISELAGVLTDATGKPGGDYTVVIARPTRATDAGSRRISIARLATDGRLRSAVAAGEYFVAAVTAIRTGRRSSILNF